MQHSIIRSPSKAVATWLYAGVFMIMIQILLGGITRLTESGLSITQWKPLTGVLPPLNITQWQAEFDKYKNTDQFRYIHSGFSLSNFKFIFFWEWFHRLWARLLGVVFLVGFFYFLVKRKFQKEMIIPMIILFLLGAMQGMVGWIMVKSGLVPEKMFVGHVELATHFIAALVLLGYTLWFALSLSVQPSMIIRNKGLRNITISIIAMLFVQLVYGAFMAGLKAASAAPTWPDINGAVIPASLNDLSPAWKNFFDNKIAVQFIHRGIAYLLLVLVLIWWFKARKIKITGMLNANWLPLLLIFVQIIIGIFTVIRSPYGNSLVWFGIAHQFVAMLFLMVMIRMLFLIRYPVKSLAYQMR
ncbi:MAG: COX15/CtaA family protein [Chitinophagaceae bacterium]|nr:COX15/CtaA family protein [Chitinophagaceae bacterium]